MIHRFGSSVTRSIHTGNQEYNKTLDEGVGLDFWKLGWVATWSGVEDWRRFFPENMTICGYMIYVVELGD